MGLFYKEEFMGKLVSARFFDRNPINVLGMNCMESELRNAFPEWDKYSKEMYWFDEQIASEPD